MRAKPFTLTQSELAPTARLPVALFLLAVHLPALLLGGNRIGLLLPTAAVVLFLLARSAPRVSPPACASWLWLGVLGLGASHVLLALTPNTGEAARILLRWTLYGAVYVVAYDMARRPGRPLFMIKAAASWIALVSAYGLAAWAAGHNPVLAELEAYPTALEATFVNRNAFALYAAFGLFASLCVCAADRRDLSALARGGWIWPAAAILCGAALALTGSRGGLGAAIIGLIVFAAFMSRRRWPAIVSALALIAAGLAGDAFLRDASVLTDPRFHVHMQVLDATMEAPITGRGLGAFQDAFRGALGTEWRWGDWDHAHQQYLETAYEIGWPAAAGLFAAILFAAPRPRRRDPITALALAALAASAAHALVDFSLTIPSVAMTLALFLGLAAGRQRRAS